MAKLDMIVCFRTGYTTSDHKGNDVAIAVSMSYPANYRRENPDHPLCMGLLAQTHSPLLSARNRGFVF
jgi:hypothetical protein